IAEPADPTSVAGPSPDPTTANSLITSTTIPDTPIINPTATPSDTTTVTPPDTTDHSGSITPSSVDITSVPLHFVTTTTTSESVSNTITSSTPPMSVMTINTKPITKPT